MSEEATPIPPATPPPETPTAPYIPPDKHAGKPVKFRKDGQIDLRSHNARAVGMLAGCPKGTKKKNKRVMSGTPEEIVERVATAIMETGEVPLKMSRRLTELPAQDREALARAVKMPYDTFVESISHHLQEIAFSCSERIKEKLADNEYRPSELNFLIAIALDKNSRLAGRSALQNASINVQVNNFGDQDKDAIIAQLMGPKKVEELGLGDTRPPNPSP